MEKHTELRLDPSSTEAEAGPPDPSRRAAVKAAARYAAYTAPAIIALSLPQAAWASHDQGQQKSRT